MSERQAYVDKMKDALARLEVKASLAKLESRDAKKELIEQYDKLHDDLHRLRDETGERWYALQEGFDRGWRAFKARYDEVMKTLREP